MHDAGSGARTSPALLAGVFLLVFITHSFSPAVTSTDSRWAILTAHSVVSEGNTDLNEYSSLIAMNPRDYRLMTIGDRVYDKYPVGPALLAVPVVLGIDYGGRLVGFDLDAHLRSAIPVRIEVVVASLLIALASMLMVVVGGRAGLSPKLALLLGVLFAFCTPVWSTGSRALWQHSPSILFLTAALWVLVRSRDDPPWIQYLSIPLALSFTMRPTNSLAILVLTVYVFVRHRRWLGRYFAWAAVVAIPFLLFNSVVYRWPLPPYYLRPFDSFGPLHYLQALSGNLASPARGLLVYCPLLLFSVSGLKIMLRDSRWRDPAIALTAIVVLHWLVISAWRHWWGGWCFGPRYFSDVTPFLVFLLVPVLAWLPRRPRTRRGVVQRGLFASLVAASLFVNARGATSMEPHRWNVVPNNVDFNGERVWDWGDPPFMRGL